MARLVRLAGDRPSDDLWINPDQLVSVRKVVNSTSAPFTLHANVKLIGQPELLFLVAHGLDLDEIDRLWAVFITSVTREPAQHLLEEPDAIQEASERY